MRNLASLLALIAVALVAPPPRTVHAVEEAPTIRLVLLVAVDQFRYDYLTRFRTEFSGGFSRLLTTGAVFTNAYLDHYPTVTAVGHSTMLSGATPALSGIVGNDWYDRALGRNVTSVSDPTTTLVGGTGEGSSPRRLLVSTVGDELKSASRAAEGAPNRPKVFGLSLKDRSAIPHTRSEGTERAFHPLAGIAHLSRHRRASPAPHSASPSYPSKPCASRRPHTGTDR